MGITNILGLLGGLGAFLFGIQYMGNGLELAAGEKMQNLLEKLTRNPILGFLLGVFVTGVIQCSSATTVMVMGFINAGIMDLAQATGVIIGANVGTTVTSILIALDVTALSPLCIGAGAFLLLYANKAQYRYVGQSILGFGILFQGIHTMSSAMSVLKEMESFQHFITSATNPFVGLLVGILICCIIQSSSAAIGVLQALALQSLMPIHFASYIICGVNIGSAFPTFLSAINAKTNAKRASLVYFIFNIVGAIIFIPITMFTGYTSLIEKYISIPVVQVSACHIIFKAVTACVLLPFTNLVVKLTCKIIPQKEHETEKRFLYIDKNLVGSPNITIKQINKEVKRMSDIVRKNFVMATEGLFKNDISNMAIIKEQETIVNYLNHSITDYLIKVNALELTDSASQHIGQLFHVINDLERIGDHAINLLEKTEVCVNHQLVYSDSARSELKVIYDKCIELYDGSLDVFMNHSLSSQSEHHLRALEDDIDHLTIESQDNHIERLRAKICHTEPGIIFAKALHDYERVGDHASNIVWAAKNEPKHIEIQ